MAIDSERIKRAIGELLSAIGEDPDRSGLQETPGRVAAAYGEIFSGYDVDPASVLQILPDERGSGLILVRDLQVTSFCEHHLLPFAGTAAVGYLPGEAGRICGLSKLSRLMEVLSRRLQVQERLAAQAADALEKALTPRGVFVMIDAEHMCMTLRGAKKPGARMVTIETRGVFDDPAERSAVLKALELP